MTIPLQIISTQEYHNFGKLENLNDEIKTFLESLAEKNSKISDSASTLITTLVKDIVSSSKQGDSAWVLVRAYIDNNQHDLPNWHTDPCLGLFNYSIFFKRALNLILSYRYRGKRRI